MRGFLKRHKIVAGGLALIALIVLFYAVVVIKAYLDTPHIIAQATAADRMKLRLEDFPDDELKILLTVEDPNFYGHHGIDFSTPGAGYTTITQGLVKQYYFDHFKPGIAKISRILIALVLDRRVDKKTQLLLFVNSVYLGTVNGNAVNGFSDASQVYFKKSFSALSKDEYLSLVAMIVGPDSFNVAGQPEKNAERVKRIKRLLKGECRPVDNSDVYYKACG